MRNFVTSHPSYAHDSVISQEINYDLIRAVDEIERGVRKEPTLLPECYEGSAQAKEGDLFKACCGDIMAATGGEVSLEDVGARVVRAVGE